jgi:hypothetical protein
MYKGDEASSIVGDKSDPSSGDSVNKLSFSEGWGDIRDDGRPNGVGELLFFKFSVDFGGKNPSEEIPKTVYEAKL